MTFTYNRNKKQNFKYGELFTKKAKAIQRDRLLVVLIGPYKIIGEGHDDTLIIKSLTMIEPVTGRFEIIQYNDKQASTIANPVEKNGYVDIHALQ